MDATKGLLNNTRHHTRLDLWLIWQGSKGEVLRQDRQDQRGLKEGKAHSKAVALASAKRDPCSWRDSVRKSESLRSNLHGMIPIHWTTVDRDDWDPDARTLGHHKVIQLHL